MAAKLVVVTGASSGIGRAVAERLAADGARVVLVARNGERLQAVAARIGAAGGHALAVPADLSRAADVTAMAERVLATAGVPDVVLNNAGAGVWKPFVETSAEEAEQMMALPYFSAFGVTRAFLPGMLARGSGQIGFVTSPASFIVWPNASAYVAARFALRGFAESLRAELRATPVAVTLVTLGMVASPYWEHNPGSRAYMPRAARLIPELSLEQAAETIVDALARRKRHAVRPVLFRLIFALGLSG